MLIFFIGKKKKEKLTEGLLFFCKRKKKKNCDNYVTVLLDILLKCNNTEWIIKPSTIHDTCFIKIFQPLPRFIQKEKKYMYKFKSHLIFLKKNTGVFQTQFPFIEEEWDDF